MWRFLTITEKYELQIEKLQPSRTKICQYGYRAAAQTQVFTLTYFFIIYKFCSIITASAEATKRETVKTNVGRFFEQYVQQLRLKHNKTVHEDLG